MKIVNDKQRNLRGIVFEALFCSWMENFVNYLNLLEIFPLMTDNLKVRHPSFQHISSVTGYWKFAATVILKPS
jgi:hypothetical protein